MAVLGGESAARDWQYLVGVMTTAQQARFRKAVEAKRRELRSNLIGGAAELAIRDSEHDPIDRSLERAYREEVVENVDRFSRTLASVEAALRAISEGRYGICSDCEEPIGLKRLEILPWATCCVRCQEGREASFVRRRTTDSLIDEEWDGGGAIAD